MNEYPRKMAALDPNLQQRLNEAVEFQAIQEPDLYFVTKDGDKVPAHRSIIILQSKLMLDILRDYPAHLTPSIHVPSIAYGDLCSLISILYTGQAWLGDDHTKLQEACEVLGLHSLRVKISKNQNHPLPRRDNSNLSSRENVTLNDSLIIEETDQKGGDNFDDKGVKRRGPKSKTRMFQRSLPSPPSKPSRANEAVMACKMCPNTSFRGVNEFESHLAMEHFVAELVTEYGSRKSKMCVLCEESFPTVQKLARHIGAEHHKVMVFYERKVEELSEIIVSKYGVDNVQCSFCKIKFRNKKLLGTHIGAVHEKFGEYLMKSNSSSPSKDLEFL